MFFQQPPDILQREKLKFVHYLPISGIRSCADFIRLEVGWASYSLHSSPTNVKCSLSPELSWGLAPSSRGALCRKLQHAQCWVSQRSWTVDTFYFQIIPLDPTNECNLGFWGAQTLGQLTEKWLGDANEAPPLPSRTGFLCSSELRPFPNLQFSSKSKALSSRSDKIIITNYFKQGFTM